MELHTNFNNNNKQIHMFMLTPYFKIITTFLIDAIDKCNIKTFRKLLIKNTS